MAESCLMGNRRRECTLAFWSLDNNPNGVMWVAVSGQIIFANRALHEMTGYPDGSLVGTHLADLDIILKPSDIGPDGHLTKLVRDGEIGKMSTSFRHADGRSFPVRVEISVPQENEEMFVAFVRDMEDDLKAASLLAKTECDETLDREGIIKDLLTDQLTGTWLRRRFFEVMAPLVAKSQNKGSNLSLLFMDVDRFKVLNDTCGHNAGDRALREIAGAIEDVIREGDFLFRWGGDEFVVLLPGVDGKTALGIAERIRQRAEVRGTGVCLDLTVSIGVAEYRPGEDITDDWIARADAAMYQVKQDGGNGVRG